MHDQADNLRAVASGHVIQGERKAKSRQGCRVIAVTGGKGGVGKTNVAVNLSLALAEGGARVLLVDGDLGLANVDLMLGLSPQYTLEHVFAQQVELRDAVVEGPLGIKVLPGAIGLTELANLNALDIVRLLGLLRGLEHEHDLLIIDTAAGIGQVVTHMALAADDVIIVTTPEPTAMVDAYGTMKALKQGNLHGNLHLLVNMVRRRGEDTQLYRSLAEVALNYLGLRLSWLGSLPRDEDIVNAIKRHRAFYLEYPSSAAARELKRIASQILAVLDIKRQQKTEGYFSRLLNSLR